MALGPFLVLIFSDPMVDVMSNVGARVTVPPFYVAFVLAPLASNASELIASVNYASKKSKKTITVALAALEVSPRYSRDTAEIARQEDDHTPLAVRRARRAWTTPSVYLGYTSAISRQGAACMNNTFCLAIFMGLIFFQVSAITPQSHSTHAAIT